MSRYLVGKCTTKGIKDRYKKQVIDEFLRCYNDIADEDNERFETWNNEYDVEFGIKNGVDEDHYNAWIAKKMQGQIDSKVRSKMLSFTVDPVDAIVHGHIKGFEKETDIYFYLVPQEA